MVYCDFIKAEDNKVVYAIGGSPNDITGRITINLIDKTFYLEEPENERLYIRHVKAFVVRNMPDFEKGIYREKLSYEIG